LSKFEQDGGESTLNNAFVTSDEGIALKNGAFTGDGSMTAPSVLNNGEITHDAQIGTFLRIEGKYIHAGGWTVFVGGEDVS